MVRRYVDDRTKQSRLTSPTPGKIYPSSVNISSTYPTTISISGCSAWRASTPALDPRSEQKMIRFKPQSLRIFTAAIAVPIVHT